MPMNLDSVGAVSQPSRASWTSKDALLYAVGVGAGQTDFKLAAHFPAGGKHREQAGQRQLGKKRSSAHEHQKKECRSEACHVVKC